MSNGADDPGQAAQSTELTALLDLLGDPDPEIGATLAARLESDADLLDRAWQAATGRGEPPAILTAIVLRADAEALVDAFAAAEDLESGCWLLARLQRPRCDHREAGAPQLDALAARVAERIAAGAPADGRTVAAYLCGECGFSGDSEAYDDPANSFLSEVLARRLGLPIALTALWQLVGRRLGVVCEALAMPGHVLGRWVAADGSSGYVDLFAGGAAVTRTDLEALVHQAGGNGVEPYLAAASDRALLKRMARNLALAYLRRGDQLRATIAHALATV
jgi:regulator of sirC expression with transglutaminase-like and TPR domain